MSTEVSIANANSIYFNESLFEHTQRVATLLSKSNVVPSHYQNNIANCFIAVATAQRMKVDPFLYMQKSFILNNKPGVESQLLIAALNNSGLVKGRIQYAYTGTGDTRACVASVIDAETGERHEYHLTLKDALQVGNSSKNPNWRNIPDLMLAYRSAAYLIRTFYPEAGMGLMTKEELEDISPIRDITPLKEQDLNIERDIMITSIMEPKKGERKNVKIDKNLTTNNNVNEMNKNEEIIILD